MLSDDLKRLHAEVSRYRDTGGQISHERATVICARLSLAITAARALEIVCEAEAEDNPVSLRCPVVEIGPSSIGGRG